nr:hypothetical protein Hi04_10k_c5966_00032 [uncultured bacterium]
MSTRHRYRIANLVLSSNILLPELRQTNGTQAQCSFELVTSADFTNHGVEWFHQWSIPLDDEIGKKKQPWLQLGHRYGGYCLRFPSMAEFIVSRDLSRIQCCPTPNIPEVTVRHLLLDQVIPLVLSRTEQIVLHASGVLTEFGTLAFVGKTGEGKSTLAASFARSGCPMLSDDCLVLRFERQCWTAIASYPGVRLWSSTLDALLLRDTPTHDMAHYTGKRRVNDNEIVPIVSGPAPLTGLFLLSSGDAEPSITRLRPASATIALIAYALNLDITDSAFLRQQFEAISDLADKVPMFELRYPREFATLGLVRQAILKQLKETYPDSL